MIHEWNRLFKKRMIWIGIILLVPFVLFAAGLSVFEQTDIIPFYTSPEDNKNTVPEGFDNKMSAYENKQNSDISANLLKDKDSKKDDLFIFRAGGGTGGNQLSSNHQNTVVQENDEDGDEVKDDSDNCPGVSNHDQEDSDKDGHGNACDLDDDNDEIIDDSDNCPSISNHDQEDSDKNGRGNACDDDSNNETSIPEFPSIALPVIATMGLLYVMRRNK